MPTILLKHSPSFSNEAATKVAQQIFGIHTSAAPLPSERDQNFLLETAAGERFVLKIAHGEEQQATLEAQEQAMAMVARATNLCPIAIPALSGKTISEVKSENGTRHFVRLVSYLPGTPMGAIPRHSPGLLYDLGRSMGRISRALAGFDHPAIHRDFHWDLANGLRVCHQHHDQIQDAGLRALVDTIAQDFQNNAAPLLTTLRRGAIHNDANDYNVIVGGGNDPASRNQSVVGLIDFGDMVYSYAIADLAVAMAYAMLDKSDPLAAAVHLVRGYHAESPLQENEIAALFGLARMRLCMSVCIAAQQVQQRPDDVYLAISQRPILNTLPALAEIHARFAEHTFRNACGLAPVASTHAVVRWLEQNRSSFASVLEEDLRTAPSIVLDLSVSSPLLSGNPNENIEPVLTKRVFAGMDDAGVKICIGRYNEPRLLYVTPLFAKDKDPGQERRTIHLGIDIFAAAGTAIFAPLAGTVHAFANRANALDYGPVIILKHETGGGEVFYTLYGHLSAESLHGLSVGKAIGQGERIASLGAPNINGGWTPHLHFQIILDMLDIDSDFPGVARATQRDVWLALSPDPNLILGIPADRFPAEPPSKRDTLERRHARIGRNLSIAYKEPIKAVRGWMQYLYDETARRYLDAYNNVPHVGHCHPRVVRAAHEQMTVLNTNTRYLHDRINEYAQTLCATLPEPLDVCFFVNSGSEANELALRLARAYTRQRDMIVLEAAYHGNTNTLIDISPYKHDGPGGTGAPDWVHTVPIADTYRGTYKCDDMQAGTKYARFVEETIGRLQAMGRGIAGYIAESCPSVGGQIVFPPGYLSAVYAHVRQAGGICIADEVQTGYGRLGTHFWGFEGQGVTPDIVVLGKPIGNGHPIGAVITTREIAASFDNGMEFFSTFGGNTVSCTVGLEVLKIVQEEKLQSHALRVGNRLLEGLSPLLDRFACVGDVRGSGLFLGLELVRDRTSLEPAAEEASFVCNLMRERGVLLGTDGPYHNVIKIRPPMPFGIEDADILIAALEKSLAEISG